MNVLYYNPFKFIHTVSLWRRFVFDAIISSEWLWLSLRLKIERRFTFLGDWLSQGAGVGAGVCEYVGL